MARQDRKIRTKDAEIRDGIYRRLGMLSPYLRLNTRRNCANRYARQRRWHRLSVCGTGICHEAENEEADIGSKERH
jgi:hypothetical protein